MDDEADINRDIAVMRQRMERLKLSILDQVEPAEAECREIREKIVHRVPAKVVLRMMQGGRA